MFYTQDLLILIYVDDILAFGNTSTLQSFQQMIKDNFECTSKRINEQSDFLGCILSKSGHKYIMSQVDMIENLLKRFANDLSMTATPLPKQTFETNVDTTFDHRSCLGSLNYLRYTRVDLLLAIQYL